MKRMCSPLPFIRKAAASPCRHEKRFRCFLESWNNLTGKHLTGISSPRKK